MKTTVIHLRATEAEKLEWEASANRAGIKLSAWIRKVANENPYVLLDIRADKEPKRIVSRAEPKDQKTFVYRPKEKWKD